ncbi:alpha-amylase family protein [Streptomyces sp. P38-E01]|uniref:Alpha-amylase n=1 Tax=Streptomyces tardus TaxID=2780544 RepID=A0A949N6T3_9ACTN|nr:alpha-amylase family protein [Streptomyces tardus]
MSWSSRARKATAVGAALSAGVVGALFAVPQSQAAPPSERDVTAVMFSWKFDAIAKACTDTLGPAGYGYVQTSPPQEHITGEQWWTQYQPVSYDIAGRLGDRAQFESMVDTCNGAGVKVVADAVINHMSAGEGTGTGGSEYTKYSYPKAGWGDSDFNECRRDIEDYGDRGQVQGCELVGLSDLRTGSEQVQQRIADYLNDLSSMGVEGFRIDAAKHMPTDDLAAIKAKLDDPNAYWKQEAIHGAGEAVDPGEYLQNGDVQEFRYARGLKSAFQGGGLAGLQNFGEGFMDGGNSAVFVANHDTERVGDTLNYKDNASYTLAHVFMLAHPYGSPDVHSGYRFDDKDAGPPSGGAAACDQEAWNCEHEWREISSMVGFRNAVGDAGLEQWWDNGSDALAFSRGDKGFVAVNNGGGQVSESVATSLPDGDYCDVQSGNPVAVSGGSVQVELSAGTALALHADATDCG